jgi:hypothetical protein
MASLPVRGQATRRAQGRVPSLVSGKGLGRCGQPDARRSDRIARTEPHNCRTPSLMRRCCGASWRKRVMQQQIGFCTTADGARIAYATVGTGPAPVVA